MEMTFRSGDLKREKPTKLTLSDLVEGDKVDGHVKKIEDYGLFIEIDGTKISGLCHKSEVRKNLIRKRIITNTRSTQLSDSKDADVTLALRSFREGDRLKVKILSIDLEKRRISFGLKPSYFEQGDFDGAEEADNEEDTPAESFGVVEEHDEYGSASDHIDDEDVDDEEGEEDDEEDEEDEEDGGEADGLIPMDIDLSSNLVDRAVPSTTRVTQVPPPETSLKLDSGFQWSASKDEDDVAMESSSDEDEEDQESKRKKRKRKEVELDLTADMHSKTPESNADFERQLLGSPNSSYLWVQYMSFQLQLSEVEKARDIGHRALKTINFREEREKLNVWIAMLNLENTYGTEESLDVALKDAARRNDPKTIYLALAAIFEDSDKTEVRR